MTDDAEYALLVPFVLCRSKDGPFDDAAFVAGFACGEISRALKLAASANATDVQFTARTELLPQLELLAMSCGYPIMEATAVGLIGQDQMSEWSVVKFRSAADIWDPATDAS